MGACISLSEKGVINIKKEKIRINLVVLDQNWEFQYELLVFHIEKYKQIQMVCVCVYVYNCVHSLVLPTEGYWMQ